MKFLPNIPSLETYPNATDIVICTITDAFWNECIKKVSQPRTRRFVAVGW